MITFLSGAIIYFPVSCRKLSPRRNLISSNYKKVIGFILNNERGLIGFKRSFFLDMERDFMFAAEPDNVIRHVPVKLFAIPEL